MVYFILLLIDAGIPESSLEENNTRLYMSTINIYIYYLK